MQRLRAALSLLLALIPLVAAAAPVEFSFKLERTAGNPFAREIWAEVATPGGHTLILPAYYAGADLWTVRTRAAALGEFKLGTISETSAAGRVAIKAKPHGPTTFAATQVDHPSGLIGIDPHDRRRFAFADGTPFVPLGANLAWAEGPSERFFDASFARFAQAGLNWSRVWMCHWGGTNLDWTQDDLAPTPPIGEIDPRVAAFWDTIVDSAERHGIYFQLVFQHHGQWNTGANTNWAKNPWNTAVGGFLKSPKEFFTDSRARELTKRKYRYIVARWGYSAAIMAWELINEAMWTDSRSGTPEDNAAVAAWHAEMADYVRSIDAHHHLVTTSDDYLDHPLYAKMDYFQPHLYPANLLTGVRHFDIAPTALDRPIFYGEVGEDNVPELTAEQKKDAFFGTAMLWAGAMGEGTMPAQLWYATAYMRNCYLPEYATFARFFRAYGLDRRTDLAAFTTVIETAEQVPLRILPAQHWHKAPDSTIAPALDGSEPADLARVPRTFVSANPEHGQPYPGRLTLRLDYPRAATARVHITAVGGRGSDLRLLLDGAVVGKRSWPASADQSAHTEGVDFAFPVAAGAHTLVLENPNGPDWFELGSIDTGLTCSPLAVVGRRAADRVVLWLWHREGIYTKTGVAPISGQVVLPDLPAGKWRVTWWDLAKGEPQPITEIVHAGGTLRLPTPPISRHAAASVELVK